MKLIAPIVIVGVFVFGLIVGKSWQFGVLEQILTKPETAVNVVVALVALVGSICGPVVAYRLGVRQADIASAQAAAAKTSADAAMTTARGAGTRALATSRLDWLKALRENLSEYHAILMSSGDPDTSQTEEEAKAAKARYDADERRLALLGTQLDLLLNQKNDLHQRLWQVSDDILKIEGKYNRWARDKELVAAARAVIENEWQKIKREMRGA
jgi:hypothetical protein